MQINRNHFTLFELLISIGLLVVLSVVLLRTIVLTCGFWSASDEQARLYADAKTVFSILGDDLSNIVYDTSGGSSSNPPKLIAPFWLGDFSVSPAGFTPNGDSLDTGKTIRLLTHTQWQTTSGKSTKSDICKVGYFFFPPLLNTAGDYTSLSGMSGKRNGILVRGYVNENATTGYNLSGGQSLSAYFAISSLTPIVDGIIDFQIYAYDKNLQRITSGDSLGMHGVRAIQISLRLIPPNRLQDFRKHYLEESTSDEEKKAFLYKYARTFRRTFWVSPMAE